MHLHQAPQLQGLRSGHFSCDPSQWAAISVLSGHLLSRAAQAGRIQGQTQLRIQLPLTTASRLHRAEWQQLTVSLDAADCRILAQLLAEWLEQHTEGYTDSTIAPLAASDEQLGEFLCFLQGCGGFAARP